MLEIKNMSFSYGDNCIYDNTSIKLNKNGIYFLDAPNGTGKSTLFKILKSDLKSSGEITVDNKINDKTITYIDYNIILEHRLTVLDQILLFTDDEEYVDKLLVKFELEDLKNRITTKLSDGERARLSFLLGILEGSSVILLDEAFAHLDNKNMDIVREVVYSLAKDKIIIYTSHKNKKIINYNYKIKIINKKLILSEENFNNDYPSLKIKEPKINKKILRKAIEYKQRYLFLFILVIFIIADLLFFNLKTLDDNTISKAFIDKSINLPYVVNKNHNIIIDSNGITPYKEEYGDDYILKSIYKLDKIFAINDFNYKQKIFAGMDYLFPCDIKNMYVIDNYHDIKLEENDIIITDYLYINFKIHEYFENVKLFTTIDNQEYILFNNIKLKIKEIIDNDYLKLLEKYYNYEKFDIDPGMYQNKDYIRNINYFYPSFYINNKTKENMFNEKYKLLNNLDIYQNNNKIHIDADISKYQDSLISGRLPNNKNEILINEKYDIYDENMYFLSCSIYYTDEDIDSLNSGKYYANNLGKQFKVVGKISSDIDYVFFDEQTKIDYYLSDSNYYKTNVITNPTTEVLKDLKQNNMQFTCDNYNEYLIVVKKVYDLKIVYNIFSFLILSLIFIIIIIYLSLENKYYYKDIKILSHKNIDFKLIKNTKYKFYLKNIIFVSVLILISFILINYYSLFNKIANIVLGLKDYKLI